MKGNWNKGTSSEQTQSQGYNWWEATAKPEQNASLTKSAYSFPFLVPTLIQFGAEDYGLPSRGP